jgi:hypothetical protein
VATLLIAPGEGAEDIVASLAELEGELSVIAADPVAVSDDPRGIAAALSAYERQASGLAPAAAIVHGSGDRPLAAVISLVKLEIPVARVAGSGDSLTELLADQTISPGDGLQEQVRSWLRRILTP